ncbi:MAG: DUF4422 domain-containing protein [Lachnospiraceae bacterium]|nr:DUF4422 domain-containing protein [Lachnospiraceae bacterium]
MENCDFVTHIGKVNHVYNHYIENHRKEDIDLAFEILYEKFPDYKEIAKEYLSGNYSNFCNMFIMRRELFFDYCEWMFELLGEFEKRVDISEKRFFISERLTGVYIAKLMKNKELKYKAVPISFVEEAVNIPIVLPGEKDNQFALATTLVSLLSNKKPESKYDIYLVTDSDITENIKKKIHSLCSIYENCNIEFIVTNIKREYYPIVMAGLLPMVNKCIYMEDNSLALKDLSEFYRVCSVDDYYVVGAPLRNYDIYETEKELDPSFMVINCASLRRHKIMQKVMPEIEMGRESATIINTVLRGQIGYVPWYLMTLAEKMDKKEMFDKNKTRASQLADAAWKPIVFYGNLLPWENPQETFSIFWWDFATKVPVMFEFVPCSLTVLEIYFANGQKEINRAAFAHSKQEDWRKYSFWGKLKFYYKHNGIKQTIKYGFRKLVGGKK